MRTVAGYRIFIRWKYALLVLLPVIFLAGCSEDDPVVPIVTPTPDDGRGRVVFAELVGVRTAGEIQEQLEEFEIPITAEYDVALYRILYETVDASGNKVVASGAIVVPQGRTSPMPLLSFQHSTITSKTSAPSEQGFFLEGMALGTGGYIAVFPDYLGLGVSQGIHPFLHASSLATAVVDMIRAGVSFCRERDIAWSEQLFLMGYSEGGFATLAVQRELEQRFADQFTITGSAPMAGPYDLSGSILTLAREGGDHPLPLFLPYLIYSYDQVYGIFDSLEQVFRQPYANTVPELFDGTKTVDELGREFPSDPRDVLTEEFLDAFVNNSNHPLRLRLRENDLYRDWTPVSPTRLFHCREDDQVPYQNSVITLEEFRSMGAPDVELGTLLLSDHRECGQPALLLGKFWFDSLLK